MAVNPPLMGEVEVGSVTTIDKLLLFLLYMAAVARADCCNDFDVNGVDCRPVWVGTNDVCQALTRLIVMRAADAAFNPRDTIFRI